MTEKILLEMHENGVAVITFNRPDALNALDVESMRRFAEVVGDLRQQDDLRTVILTGAGDSAFCSGGDLFELSKYNDETFARHFITTMGDALLLLERLPVPVIAAVNGYALGGGSEIAVACDLRVVDDNARMGFVQIRLALTPGWGAGQRLMRLVGYSRALDILLRGQVLHAHQVEALGLANKIVERGMALKHALNMARYIAEQPPDAVRGIKALLQAGLNTPYEEALKLERDLFPPLWAAEPHLRAVDAFLERNEAKTNQR